MKIIFLDIDGVLNSLNGIYKRGVHSKVGIFAEHVDILNIVLRHTDAKIVVSSSWRKNREFRDLKYELYNAGIPSRYIIDTTPELLNKCRGEEIEKWIIDNNFTGDYVILDDDSDMGGLLVNLVQTNHKYGLTYIEAVDIICRLNKVEVQEIL